jgi:hypothetical protein
LKNPFKFEFIFTFYIQSSIITVILSFERFLTIEQLLISNSSSPVKQEKTKRGQQHQNNKTIGIWNLAPWNGFICSICNFFVMLLKGLTPLESISLLLSLGCVHVLKGIDRHPELVDIAAFNGSYLTTIQSTSILHTLEGNETEEERAARESVLEEVIGHLRRYESHGLDKTIQDKLCSDETVAAVLTECTPSQCVALGLFEMLRSNRLHETSATVYEALCSVLHKAAKHFQEQQGLHKKDNIITRKVTDSSRTDTEEVEESEFCVRYFAGCELVLTALTIHLKHAVLAEKACLAFWGVTLDRDMKIKLGSMGICEKLVEILKEFRSNAGVVNASCAAMSNLALYPANKIRLAKLGACELVLDVLNTHINDPSVLEKTFFVITNIITLQDEYKRQCGKAWACELLMKVLDIHKGHIGVVTVACAALGNLARILENRNKLTTLRGCEVLIELLQEYHSNTSIAQTVCSAISTMAADEANQIQFGRLGRCELLLNVLLEHMNHSGVVIKACAALANISKHTANELVIGNAGGCELLLQVLETNQINEDVVVNVSAVIVHVAVNMENQNRFVKADGSKTLFKVLKEQKGHLTAVKNICSCIGNLAEQPVNKTCLVEDCELLLEVLKEVQHDASVANKVCFAIWNLALNEDNNVRFGNAGGCELLLQVYETHKSSQEKARNALQAVKNLATTPENYRRMVNAGGGHLLSVCIIC